MADEIHTNGVNPDTEPETLEAEAGQKSEKPGYASQNDIYMTGDRRGGPWNPGKELFEGSADPTMYLPRTRIDEREIALSTRMFARYNRRTKGYSDMPGIFAFKYNARMGRDGGARKELIKIAAHPNYDWMPIHQSGTAMTGGKDLQKNDIRRT